MDLQSLEIRVARSENLPVLPQIVSHVLKLADNPDAGPKDMEKIIERDPAVTAKILRVANSSYYGLSQIQSINRAISMLGMNTIRSLVVGVAFQQIISTRTPASKFNKLEFWRHSLGVAIGSRILGKLKQPLKAEELYVAGMLHDVGLLALDRFHPTELDQAFSYALETDMQLHEAEKMLFGFDHAQVGGLCAERWGLSDLVLDAIRHHHGPRQSVDHLESTAIVGLADSLAHQCGLTNNFHRLAQEVEPELLEIVDLPAEQLDAIKNVIVLEISRAEEAFNIC